MSTNEETKRTLDAIFGKEVKPRPKPAPPKPKTEVLSKIEENTKLKSIVGSKPKFVRQLHLTERPLKGHEGLAALAKTLETPRRGQRRTNKEKK